MIDTHTHLNFKRFKKNIASVIEASLEVGVKHFVVPGTDITSSKKALELSGEYECISAAVGIHPHHVFELTKANDVETEIKAIIGELGDLVEVARHSEDAARNKAKTAEFNTAYTTGVKNIEKITGHDNVSMYQEYGSENSQNILTQAQLTNAQLIKAESTRPQSTNAQSTPQKTATTSFTRGLVAIGEIGLDFHEYENTKYTQYKVNGAFIENQKILLKKQLELAMKSELSIILHNREAADSMLPIMNELWNADLREKMVFHCCEPNAEILQWAKDHKVYIGVDGDVTYWKDKRSFINEVPLDMLVLETDAPFLLPEPLRSKKLYPNTPANLPLIVEAVAVIKGESKSKVISITTENAQRLFTL